MLTLSARLCCWARLKQQRILFFSYTPHRWRSRVAASGWSKRSSGRHTRAATLQRQHVAVRPWCPPGGRARVCVCVSVYWSVASQLTRLIEQCTALLGNGCDTGLSRRLTAMIQKKPRALRRPHAAKPCASGRLALPTAKRHQRQQVPNEKTSAHSQYLGRRLRAPGSRIG